MSLTDGCALAPGDRSYRQPISAAHASLENVGRVVTVIGAFGNLHRTKPPTRARDAGLLGAAQAVEHYEISRYGILKAWARELGLDDAVGLLEETLQEEKDTDATLT